MGALVELVFIFQVLGKIGGKKRRRIHCENYCTIRRERKEF